MDIEPSPSDVRRTRVSRRKFVATAGLAFVGAACRGWSAGLRSRSAVGLFHADSYASDLVDVISRGLVELQINVAGRRVFLKPNLVEYEPGTAINTHPAVVTAAAITFLRAGAASVVVGEGPGHRRDIEYLLTSTGLFEHLRENRLRFVDLNHDDVQRVKLGSRFTGLSEMALPVELLASDFVVSMPKLKTHHWAGITCSMKNLFGTVPGAVYGWPKNLLHLKGIANSILDLNSTIRPQLAIVDAITAMDGDGPIMGRARHVGFVGISGDLAALDATCARIIGLDPYKLEYLARANGLLGNIDEHSIDYRGEGWRRYAAPFDVIEPFKSKRLAPA